jgi:hypothetical protein
MTCPIARSQIVTSKKPKIGAIYLNPRDIMMYRIVPIDTSTIRAKKIKSGITTNAKMSVDKNPMSIPNPFRSIFRLAANYR